MATLSTMTRWVARSFLCLVVAVVLFVLWGPLEQSISDFHWSGDTNRPRAVQVTTYGAFRYLRLASAVFYLQPSPGPARVVRHFRYDRTALVETSASTLVLLGAFVVLILKLRRRAT